MTQNEALLLKRFGELNDMCKLAITSEMHLNHDTDWEGSNACQVFWWSFCYARDAKRLHELWDKVNMFHDITMRNLFSVDE